MNRGQLTDKIQKMAIKFLGREITQTELRLYPYIDYCLKNFGRYEVKKLNLEEWQILMQLACEFHIDLTNEHIFTTKKFYDFIQKILYESYVETKTGGPNGFI